MPSLIQSLLKSAISGSTVLRKYIKWVQISFSGTNSILISYCTLHNLPSSSNYTHKFFLETITAKVHIQIATHYVFVKSLNEPQFSSRILANSSPLTNDTISSSSTSTATSNLNRFFFMMNISGPLIPVAGASSAL